MIIMQDTPEGRARFWAEVAYDRLSSYDDWPRPVRIGYGCTFPISCPLLLAVLMLGTLFGGLVLAIGIMMGVLR